MLAFLILNLIMSPALAFDWTWRDGRATFYGLDGWNIMKGSCEYYQLGLQEVRGICNTHPPIAISADGSDPTCAIVYLCTFSPLDGMWPLWLTWNRYILRAVAPASRSAATPPSFPTTMVMCSTELRRASTLRPLWFSVLPTPVHVSESQRCSLSPDVADVQLLSRRYTDCCYG